MASRWALFALLAPLSACAATAVPTSLRCDLSLASATPAAAAPGEAVVIAGTPFTTAFDTVVLLGGLPAEISLVDRTSCDACDTCRAESTCTGCSDCDACDATCTDTCAETITITVPVGAPVGATTLTVRNAHGEGRGLAFEVLPSAPGDDTGASDGSR